MARVYPQHFGGAVSPQESTQDPALPPAQADRCPWVALRSPEACRSRLQRRHRPTPETTHKHFAGWHLHGSRRRNGHQDCGNRCRWRWWCKCCPPEVERWCRCSRETAYGLPRQQPQRQDRYWWHSGRCWRAGHRWGRPGTWWKRFCKGKRVKRDLATPWVVVEVPSRHRGRVRRRHGWLSRHRAWRWWG